jgi:hypothetical protein
MLLALSTWSEIETFLKTSKSVVVPIGSNEQHGPTGLLGTDWLCPEIISHEAQRLSDTVLVAPTFNIGMAQHHLAFPGTIFLRPSTFIAAIGDWVRSLGAHGFERIYFLNGHGGNVASIEAAFRDLCRLQLPGRKGPVRPETEELVGSGRGHEPGQPPVSNRPWQPCDPVRDRGDPVGLSAEHQDHRL